MRKPQITRSMVWTSFLPVAALLCAGCASRGLLSAKYEEGHYRIENRLPDQPLPGPVRFIVYGDNQVSWQLEKAFSKTSWTDRKMFIFPFYQLYLLGRGTAGSVNWFRNVPDYGGQERRQIRDAIYEQTTGGTISFVLNVGDVCAHDGRRPSHWKTFLDENRVEVPLVDSVPYIAIRGNHEVTNDEEFGAKNFDAIFGLPPFDMVEMDNAALIIIDSNLLVDQRQLIDDDRQESLFNEWFVSGKGGEPSWLELQLDSTEKPFIIVAMHHPLLTFAGHAHDWTNEDYGRDLHEKRLKLLRLLSSKGVDLVFSGHDHYYQHTRFTDPEGNSTSIIIGGGGGALLRRLLGDDDINEVKEKFATSGDRASLVSYDRTNHFEIVDVGGESIRVEVMRTGLGNGKSSLYRVIELMVDGSFTDEAVETRKD
jgi:hypothetical protein